jgi:predicted Fe-Mo cluster-binding NifX family protein
MIKTAFAYWENRIAPVFDIARDINIIEVESGKIIGEAKVSLSDTMPGVRALRLAELGISTLVCGAISSDMHKLVEAYGIQVISFVAGDTQDVIHAWLTGDIHDGFFCMPGCGLGNKHRHRGMHRPGSDGPVMNKNSHLSGRGTKVS